MAGRADSSHGFRLVLICQDTAKSFHDPSIPQGGGTLVDLNRAGAALVEIVTRPDMQCVAALGLAAFDAPS